MIYQDVNSLFFLQILYHHAHIFSERKGTVAILGNGIGIVLVQAYEHSLRIAIGHLLKRITDNGGRIETYTQFKKDNMATGITGNETLVTVSHVVPSLVLNETGIRTDMDIHRAAANGTNGNELRGGCCNR